MEERNATLSAGFDLDPGDAFATLDRFDNAVEGSAAAAVQQLDRIEKAAEGLTFGAASVAAKTFGENATKEVSAAERATAKLAAKGEDLVKSLNRQTEALGMTRAARQALNAETLASRLEARGKEEAAASLRTAQAALEAAKAKEEDAAAVRRLRASTEPLIVAEERLNKELAEGRRLFAAGAIDAGTLARAETVLAGRLAEVKLAQAGVANSTNGARAALQNAGFQVSDFAVQVIGGTSALRAFAMQFPQLAGAVASAGGETSKLAAFLGGPWGIALTLGITVVAGFADKLLESGDASKEAKKSFEAFVQRQADIGNYIDQTTGKLREQNRTLIDNAILTRQAAIDKNKAAFAEQVLAASRAATAARGSRTPIYTAGGVTTPNYDREIDGVFERAKGNLAIVSRELINLSRARPELRGVAKTVSDAVAQAILLKRENEKLGGEIDQLTGKTIGQASATADLVRKQVELRTATTPLERARAAYSLVLGKGEAAERAGAAALEQYREELTSAARAVNAAEAAEDAAREGRTARTRDIRDAAKAKREVEKATRDALRAEQESNAWQISVARDLNKGLPVALKTSDDLGADAYKSMMDDVDARAKKSSDYRQELFEKQSMSELDWLDRIDERAQRMADNMERAFGRVGGAMGEVASILVSYGRQQEQFDKARLDGTMKQADYERRSADLQLNGMLGLTRAARGFLDEKSKGYKALMAAEQALTLVQLARTAVDVAGGAAKMFATLGPFAFPAVAAMLGVMASLGFSGGGGGGTAPSTNSGSGTVLGDAEAKSKSLERAIQGLQDIDLVTMQHSADMAASLRSIDQKIGGLSSLIVRAGNVNADTGIATGFKSSVPGVAADLFGLVGLGGVVKSLFGTKTSIVANGLFGGPQAIADILNEGFDLSYFSDVKKTKKFFGISTSSKYSTQFTDASGEIEQQFSLILRDVYSAITAAAPALGAATADFEARLNGFVVDLGRIDLKDLSGEEIQERLSAVFGAAADEMAAAAMPGLERFQAVGEGLFETLVRVASTTEAVGASLGRLGANAQNLGVDASVALAGLFDDVGDLTAAAGSFFSTFYTPAEQAARKTDELTRAMAALGFELPGSIASYRQLVEAQDLQTDAGRQAYAMLLQLAPAFADLASAGQEATSAAAIVRERQDLEREYLELTGDTAALRALELAGIDASNRALQVRNWALADEREASEAAAQVAREAAQAAEQAATAERQRLESIASERVGLERQLLEALGDTATIRALELAALDLSNRALKERLFALEDERAANELAAQQAAEQAQRAQALADQRVGLERRIIEMTESTTAIRARDLAALDATLRPLQLHIWALEDQRVATEEATRAAEEAAQRARAIADERAGLDRRILDLTGNTAAIRALELAALDQSNRDLQLHIWALEDQASAASVAAQAAQEAAQQEQALADRRLGFERQIMELEDRTAAIRALDLAALDATLQPLQLHVWALQDQAAATAAAAQAADQAAATQKAIADEGAGLMSRIWQLTGDTAAIRAAEMAVTSEVNRATLARIFALEDEQKAAAAAATAMAEAQRVADEAAKAAEQLAEAWRSIGDGLMEQVRKIRGEAATEAESFAVLQGRFNFLTAAARAGDQDAAKELTSLSQSLLAAAEGQATSRQELDRVRFETANSLEETARLIGWVAKATTPTASVIGAPEAASTNWWSAVAGSAVAASVPPPANDEARQLRQDVANLRSDLLDALAQLAAFSRRTAEVLERVQIAGGGDALAVAGVADDPIEVRSVAA